MLSVEEARQRILSYFDVLSVEHVPLVEALGQVLAEDMVASFNIPPMANSAMDGYAVLAQDTNGASKATPVELPVTGVVAAGALPDHELAPGTAIRIMTGAPVPPGTRGCRCRWSFPVGTDGHLISEAVVRIGKSLMLKPES